MPITMRHARHGSTWAIARFDCGGFALYRRGRNSVWYSETAAPVRIIVGTIYAA